MAMRAFPVGIIFSTEYGGKTYTYMGVACQTESRREALNIVHCWRTSKIFFIIVIFDTQLGCRMKRRVIWHQITRHHIRSKLFVWSCSLEPFEPPNERNFAVHVQTPCHPDMPLNCCRYFNHFTADLVQTYTSLLIVLEDELLAESINEKTISP